MQETRVDVRRIDEEVRAVALTPGRLVQLGKVLAQLSLGVAPGEVGIALGIADLAQARHHRRGGESFGEKDHLRVLGTHVADQPLPERQRLGVRVVDAKGLHALFHPAHHDVTQLGPQAGDGIGRIEIDVDDVLVLFRRIFRVFDRAVRAPVEPTRMLFEPWVVLGALDGEIQGDFQAVVGSSLDQPAEIIASAQLRVNSLVTALLTANGVGAARIIRAGGE